LETLWTSYHVSQKIAIFDSTGRTDNALPFKQDPFTLKEKGPPHIAKHWLAAASKAALKLSFKSEMLNLDVNVVQCI